MFQTEVDKARNLVILRYSGEVTVAETKSAADQIEAALPRLQPGFRLLTDMSGLAAMAPQSVPQVQRMMDACNRQGVGLVVRVIPDPHKDIGLNIMSLFHYGRGVRIVTCETLEAAQHVLEG